MSSDFWCKKCGQFMLFSGSHECPPMWYVWAEWYQPSEIFDNRKCLQYASDEENAAIGFAQRDDEYPEHLDLWVISVERANELIDEFEDIDELDAALIKNAKVFEARSELVRSWSANKKDVE